MALTVKKLADPWSALGVAAHFVARHEPFGSFPAGELVRTLAAQTRLGHYLFAFDTATEPAKVVGYFGWALYDAATAERLAVGNVRLPDGLRDGGEVIWMLTAAAVTRDAFFALRRSARALYPTHRVMAVRHKADGRRIVLDQSRRRGADSGAT